MRDPLAIMILRVFGTLAFTLGIMTTAAVVVQSFVTWRYLTKNTRERLSYVRFNKNFKSADDTSFRNLYFALDKWDLRIKKAINVIVTIAITEGVFIAFFLLADTI